MSGVAWGKFFWSDWRSDPALRLCGLPARGLWIDILAIMAEADGYLLIAGRPPTPETLARIIGSDPADVIEALAELEEHGVFSRTRAKVIYSRRMVRDEKRRSKGRETGPLAHAVSRGNDNENPATPQGPPGRDQKPEPEPEARESDTVVPFPLAQQAAPCSDWPGCAVRDLLDELARAVQHPWLDPSKDIDLKLHRTAPSFFARWRDAGCSWEADIVPQAAALCTGAGSPVRSLKFFDGAVLDAQRNRTAPHQPRPPQETSHVGKLARKNANLERSVDAARQLAAYYAAGGGDGFDDD